jgi:phage-related protein
MGREESMTDEEKLEQARRTALAKIGFIRHAGVYLLVMAVLAIINNVTWGGYQWWLWPALGWGIGVVSHFLSVFLSRSSALVDRVTRRELEKMNEADRK